MVAFIQDYDVNVLLGVDFNYHEIHTIYMENGFQMYKNHHAWGHYI